MKNKINLGIIGKNFGYNVIYKSFLKNKKFKILGFSFKSKGKKGLQIPKSIKIYPNWKKLVLDKKINAIAISTPPLLNKRIIKFAIKHNKHIFCEKPFTCSIKEANYVCKLLNKKNISHMVNYEFPEIDAFRFFKKKVLKKNFQINKIDLDWIVNARKKSKINWKEDFKSGGGIIFNYACHAIYYLEFLFGKIASTKSNISLGKQDNLNSVFYFKSGLSANLKVKSISKNMDIRPKHQLRIIANKNVYFLKSKINNLSDQFEVVKNGNYLFKNKDSNKDFRIKPTFKNSKKFSYWILKKKIQKPNFFDGQRIHLIINKMLLSSIKKKKIYIS